MNSIVFLSLLTLSLCFGQETVIGPDGQVCTPPTDDNPPDACTATSIPFDSLAETVIECEENFDCCLCESITCGTIASKDCDKFVAGGDQAAFGVGSSNDGSGPTGIFIYGDPEDGASAECGGDSSCEGARVRGSGVKKMDCGGDRSCYDGNWEIECVAEEFGGCEVSCGGDESCSGKSPDDRSMFVIVNSNGFKCGDTGCQNASFTMDSNIGGKGECDGEGSCTSSIFRVSNIESFGCNGDGSCNDTEITISGPLEDFEMLCKGVEACKDSRITIIIPAGSPDISLKGIDCGEERACQNTVITIINRGSNDVTFEELNCEAPDGCDGLQVELEGGDIIFNECKCGEQGGCLTLDGLPQCLENYEKLECFGATCADKMVTITNPKNGFELICGEGVEGEDGSGGCKGFELEIVITDEAADKPITKLKGTKCEENNSCQDLTVTFKNGQADQVITVEEITCNGDDGTSCIRAVFEKSGISDVVFEKIECNGNCGTDGNSNQCLADGTFCGDESISGRNAAKINGNSMDLNEFGQGSEANQDEIETETESVNVDVNINLSPQTMTYLGVSLSILIVIILGIFTVSYCYDQNNKRPKVRYESHNDIINNDI